MIMTMKSNETSSKKIDPDNISEKDLLDRERFALEISNNISRYFETEVESLVIGIHGPWGSGKSTLLDFIKKHLKKTDAYKNALKPLQTVKSWKPWKKSNEAPVENKLYIMEFNPWMFSGKEQLHKLFLNEFALKIEHKKQEIRTKIETLAREIQWIENLGGVGAAATASMEKFATVSLDQLKQEIGSVLVGNGIRVVIFIDDLDRLAPLEILEIFQLIKLNGNFKNTIFVISFDKVVVTDSIKNQYALDGEKYLEKIVQVDYSLPSILAEDIESMFFDRLKKVLEDDKIQFEVSDLNMPWLIDGLRYYFRNIRDLNRYFNSISFRLPSIHQEVNIHDFLIIEAIRLFDFRSYEIIRDNFDESRKFDERSHFKKELDSIDTRTSRLYKYLFDLKNQKTNLKDSERRIFDPEFFDRYFALSVSKKDMREEEYRNFLFHQSVRASVLDNAIRSGKIEFLLRRLSTKSDDTLMTDISSSAWHLLSAWDNYQEQFAKHWRDVWNAIKVAISTSAEEIAAWRKFVDDLLSISSAFSPARFTFTWLILQNVNRKDERNLDKDLESVREVFSSLKDKIESSWKHTLENYQTYFFFGSSFDVLYQRIFLPSYATYNPDNYQPLFRQMISDERGVFKVLDMVVYRDSATGEPFGINPQHIDILLPDKLRVDFEARLKKINLKGLPKSDAKTIEAFLFFLREGTDPLIGRRKV